MNGTHQMGGMRVLIVEDEPACRDALKTMLMMRGASVATASDAEQALRSFSPSDFDAILADIRLPGMNGLSLLRDIRSRYPDFPVILMTGYSSVSSAVDALKLGADDYLVKPIHDHDKLLDTLWSSIERHRLILRNKSLQEQLRSSEEKYRALFENAGDMIIVVLLNPDGGPAAILEANRSACSAIGLDRDRLRDRPFADLLPPLRRKDTEAFLRASASGAESYETFFVSASGDLFPVELRVERLILEGKPMAIVVARDISERIRMEQDLAEANERDRQHLGREIHDALCQDLTSVTILAASLQKRLASEKSQSLADAAMIHQISKRAVAFCKHLCAGLFPAEMESEGLVAALESLARETSHMFGVSCEASIDRDAVPRTRASSLHAYRIVQEAVGNAIKHGGATRIEIRLARRSDGLSVLTVRDNGRGFGAVPQDGKHLGLKIMSYRARVMGGSLTVENGEGGGASISCIWP